MRVKLTAEWYHPGSFAAPEGGPEAELLVDYDLVTEEAAFVSGTWTHDGSPLDDPESLDWARNWVDMNGDKVDKAAKLRMGPVLWAALGRTD